MIRWRFVLTRVIVILAVLMLVRWGLSPIANFLTIQGLQAATGAKVEISQTRVGLFPPRVQYVGRTWRASTSEGYPTLHHYEQDRIVRAALGVSAV